MYCRHCGAELRPDDRFCPNCGGSQDPSTPTSPQPTSSRKGAVLAMAAAAVVVLLGAVIMLYVLRGRQALTDVPPTGTPFELVEAVVEESTPTPRAPVTLNLTPQGGDGYSSLEEALADVPAGSTIYLGLGTYELSQAVSVDIPITLIGEGVESTIITGADAPHVIRFNGEGTLSLEGIHFQHEGETVADVVVINTVEAEIRNCSFSGAFRGDEESVYGGLWMTGETEGVVEGSEASGNDAVGFLLDEDAMVTLVDVVAMNNTLYGVYFLERSSGEVQESYCSSNESHGIYLDTEGEVVLSRNTCRDNESAGIGIANTASPVVSENYVEMNGLSGVIVSDSATPLIEGNDISSNGESGIAYFSESGGTASGNRVYLNGLDGISVNESAAPDINGNELYENEDFGLAYRGDAGGTASGNSIHGNLYSGVKVQDSAQPVLMDNDIYENVQSGIAFFDTAGGTASGNRSFANGYHGMGVQDQAAPLLEDNELFDNQQSGVYFLEQAAGSAIGNVISGNGYSCIRVADEASPLLEGNTCSGNTYGIRVDDTAYPILRDNEESAAAVPTGGGGAQWISGDARYADDPPMMIAYANTRYTAPPSGVSIYDSGGDFWRMNEWVALLVVGDWIEAAHYGPEITSVGVQFWGDNDDGYARVIVDGVERWTGNTYGADGNYPGGAFVNYLYFTDLGPGPHTIRVENTGQTGGGANDNVTVMFFGFE